MVLWVGKNQYWEKKDSNSDIHVGALSSLSLITPPSEGYGCGSHGLPGNC